MSITRAPKNFEFTGSEVDEFHLGKKCLKMMKKYAHKNMQINITDNISETHGSVLTRCIRLGHYLQLRGVRPGDVIMLCSSNNNDICVPLITGLFLGAPTLAIPENLTEFELRYFMQLALPYMTFCNYDQADRIYAIGEDLHLEMEIVVIGGPEDTIYTRFSDLQKPTGMEEHFRVTEFDPKTTTALIPLSSGTMGMPKGVCLTHENIAYVIGLPVYGLEPDIVAKDSTLNFASLSWISGSLSVILTCVLGQTWLHTPLDFTPDRLYKAYEKYKPSVIILAEAAATEFANHPEVRKKSYQMPSLKILLVLGSFLPTSMSRLLKSKTPNGYISNNYGMTECSGPVTTVPPGCEKENSVGKVLPWLTYKLICQDTGEEVKTRNQTGEIWVKGPTVFKEYYNRKEATQEVLCEGFYRTGDLLYQDKEGYLYFVGRTKEMLKYRASHVSPVELELVIRDLDEVEYVCVVGISKDENGDLPLAFVQKAKGCNLTAQDIKDTVKENLSDWKQLRGGVVFLDVMPLTHNGKVDRKLLNATKNKYVPE